MKRLFFILCCLLCTALCADEPRFPKYQTRCPLTDEPINRQFYVDHEGKRLYGCSPRCVEKFKENPKKFIRQLEAEGILLEVTPKEEKK